MDLTFIAGYETEKTEIKKLIDMLQNYAEYEKEGIYVPKGLILQGPPGCGKTLFAKAIAGECKVPFLSFSIGSDTKESLKSLKKLFKEAKEQTPSILYIDEIDKIVSRRYLDDDSVRAATQLLLSELDGINNSQGVLVVASTNFYDELPESLVRSGRMDKKIIIGTPDLESRIAIIDFYVKNKDAFKNISTKNLAVKLDGFSGADIKTLVNNALIESKYLKRPVEMGDFAKLIDEMEFEDIGRRWKSKEAVAKVIIHEAGHAVVRWALTGKASAISGIAYASSAGHTTFFDDWDDEFDDLADAIAEEEKGMALSKQDMFNSIASCFGGISAEKAFYGSYDSGGCSDINSAGIIFDNMCNLWFFSSDLIGINPERCLDAKLVHKYLRLKGKVFNKQLSICNKIIKSRKALICYLTEKALENDDTLSTAQFDTFVEEYLKDEKKFAKIYASWRVDKFKSNEAENK